MGLQKRFTLNASDVLGTLLTVDGPGSKLDADFVDGMHAHEIVNSARDEVLDQTSQTPMANKIPIADSTGKLNAGWVNSTLPVATRTTLGGVIVGNNLTLGSDGLIAADFTSINQQIGDISSLLDTVNGEVV